MKLFGRHLLSRPLPREFSVDDRPRGIECDKWCASEIIQQISRIVGVHPYPFDELMLMAAAFQYIRPTIVIEIGTHIGKSARIWWELSRAYRIPAAIHTIDLFDATHDEYPAEQLGKMIKGLPVTQHVGDGYAVAGSLLTTAAQSRCLLFLDGDHAYESVARELSLAVKYTQVACVLVHDTFYQPDSTYNHGPYEAVRDFVANHSVKQVVHAHLGLPGMSYLRL